MIAAAPKHFNARHLFAVLLGAVALFGVALVATASGPIAPGNPDLPWFMQNPIDEARYMQQRDVAIAKLRGFPDAGPDSRPSAIRQMIQQQADARTHAPSAVASAWTAIGPAPIPNGQTQTVSNPVSGRLTTMVVDPTNSNILYVGAAQGGVWRSLDGGASFIPIFDSAQSLSIGALTLDPNDHTRLWVGTGEPNGSCDSFAGVGLYRVESANTAPLLVGPINPARSYLDAGNVPQSVPVFNGRSISKILIDPGNSNTVFASTAGGIVGIGCDAPSGGSVPPLGIRGLYRLSAATGPIGSIGVERIKVSVAFACFDNPCTGNRNVNDMVFDPSNANNLIVWQNGTNAAGDGGVWRSTNALATPGSSVTFAQTLATTSTSTSNGRGALAIYKPIAAPAVLYVASGEPASLAACVSAGHAGALRKSVDGGATWSAKLAGGSGFCANQCFYNIGLAVVAGLTPSTDSVHIGGNVSSTNCQRLHAVSTDGGASFANQSTGLHADTHEIYVDPNTSTTIYHLDDGGIFKSTNSGTNWTSLNGHGFNVTQFQSLAVHPSDRNFTIGGTQDNGTECLGPCNQVGTSWIRADFGDGGFALIDQNAAGTTNVTMYHTYFSQTNLQIGFARNKTTACAKDAQWSYKGIYAGSVSPTVRCDGSTDTFNGIAFSDPVQFYAPMALGPGNPNTVYFGTDKLYRSTDRGDTMPAVSQAFGIPLSAIGISPQNDNGRVVGLRLGGVYATQTGANPLTNVTGGLPAKYVARALFDPSDATLNTAYVALGGYFGAPSHPHVWKTTNLMAGTWAAASNGLPDVPVNAFVIDPVNSNHLYAGTDIGVYASTNGGANWAPFGVGLPIVAVFDMAIQNNNRLLRIATHGRGIWELNLNLVFDLFLPFTAR